MGIFSKANKTDKKAAQSEQWRAELDRISALPLPDFAAEVMQRGFGSGAVGDRAEIKVNGLFDMYAPLSVGFGVDLTPRLRIEDRIREAVQALTNAGLLVATASGGDAATTLYRKSAAGQQALDDGSLTTRLAG